MGRRQQRDDDGGRECVRRVGQHEGHPRGVDVSAEIARQAADEQPGGDEQRHERRRRQEQRRHEHELRRHGVARADVEAHLLGQRVGGDQAGGAEERHVAHRWRQHGQRGHRDDQQRAERDLHAQNARGRGQLGTRAGAEQLLDVGIVL